MSAPRRRVFLSYGRQDDESFVDKIYRHLKQLGVFAWYDRENLLARGAAFTDEIAHAVDDSDLLLLFVGPHASGSEWVRREWLHALKHCIPVIPLIVIGDGEIGPILAAGDYPRAITAANAIDCRAREGEAGFAAITAKLAQFIRAEPLPLATPLGAKALPAAYVERPIYLDAVKQQLGVNDPTRPDRTRVAAITAQQESAALQGIGGIGKTTLALAACADCDVRRTFDPIVFIELGPERAAAALPTLLHYLGAALQPGLEPYQDLNAARIHLSGALRGRRTLVVLDDLWAEGIVEGFSFGGVDCRLLVTTRNKALVEGATAVDRLSAGEAAQLMANVLGVASDKLPAACADIAATLDGHTQAVEIAAAWLKKYGLARAAGYLADLRGPNALSHLQLSATDKNKNLERSLSLSYGALDDDLQRRFRATGIFAPASGFDLAALAAAWGDGAAGNAALYPATALVELSLLTHDPATDRYAQHPLLRAYARALLHDPKEAEAGEIEAVFGRYADYVIDASAAFDELPMERWGELDPLLPHVDFVGEELAARWADEAKRDNDLTRRAGDFAWNVGGYVYYRPQAVQQSDGLTTLRGLNWLEMGLEVYEAQGDSSHKAKMLHNLGSVYLDIGQVKEALRCFQQALLILKEVGDQEGEASTLHQMGSVYYQIGQIDEALCYFQQSLPIREAARDRAGEAATLHNLGQLHSQIGQLSEALRYFQQALTIRQAVRDRAGEAATVTGIGSVYLNIGQVNKALHHFQQALPIQKEMGDRAGEAATLHQVGGVYSEIGQMDKALHYFQEALRIRQAVGDRAGEAATCFNIGMLYFQQSDLGNAIMFVERAVQVTFPQDPNLPTYRQTLDQLMSMWDGGQPPSLST